MMKQRYNNADIFNTASIIFYFIYDMSTREQAFYIVNQCKV